MPSDKFLEIVKEIKEITIQGAQNIAIKGSEAFYNETKEVIFSWKDEITPNSFLLKKEILKLKEILFNARVTEPFLRNSVNFIIKNLDFSNKTNLLKSLEKSFSNLKIFFEESEKKIIEIGSNLIKNGMIVFTHCHSSTVVDILKRAKDKNISFEVHNTETRPLYQGRKTAKELVEYGIVVKHFTDLQGRIALKKADLFLFGCDAISSNGKVINKVGTELFAEIAHKRDIGVYSCTNSWKMDPFSFFNITEIETRDHDEVWNFKHKNLNVVNYAFEATDFNLINGIITELGIIRPDNLLTEFKLKYSSLFE
jgi:ribose 1,5-bisphosphate isomerase